MYRYHHNPSLKFFALSIVMGAAVLVMAFSPPVNAELPSSTVNAFFLVNVPTDYNTIEKFFLSIKDSGADTIILKPALVNGSINKLLLGNEVFLAHQAGFKLFVLLPNSTKETVFSRYPEWEDRRYDLASGTVQPSGKLDLFHPYAVGFLAAAYKDIASYSVDGILFGEDFYYSPTEGMSPSALKAFKNKFGSELAPREVFAKAPDNERSLVVEALGPSFWKWTELKKSALLSAYQTVVKAVRSVNPTVKIGVPLHANGLITNKEELGRYASDVNSYRNLNVDYYWISVPHREIRAQQELSYTGSMEFLSRIVASISYMIKEPGKMIIVVQTSDQQGKLLPPSEIEEATDMVKHAGEPGIAFSISADSIPPPVLTKKAFKRR